MKRNRRTRTRPLVRAIRAAARAGVTVAAIAAAGVGGTRLALWAKAHPYFSLREIRIDGNRTTNPSDLVEWAGLEQGMSTLDVHVTDVETRLLAHDRIRRAAVERTLPDRVRIVVEEREPVGVVLAGEARFFDRDGMAFAPTAGERLEGLPYVTGLRGGDLEERPAWSAERLRRAAALIEQWRRRAAWPEISEVRPESDSLVVYVVGARLAVRFDAEADPAELDRLDRVFELWRGHESMLSGVDLSVPDQAILKVRRGGRAERKLGARGATGV